MADKNWQMPSNTIRLSATKSGDKRRFSCETVPPRPASYKKGSTIRFSSYEMRQEEVMMADKNAQQRQPALSYKIGRQEEILM